MQPETIIDYMQIDIDGVITVETVELPDGVTAGDHVVVGDHGAEPAVARVLDVGPDRTAIRVLPGTADDHADLIGHSSPTLTS